MSTHEALVERCNHRAGTLLPTPDAPTYNLGPGRGVIVAGFARCQTCSTTLLCLYADGCPPYPHGFVPLLRLLRSMDRGAYETPGTQVTL